MDEQITVQRQSSIGGCGTALPGLVTAVVGARVILTDRHDSTRLLDNINCIVNTNNPTHWVSGVVTPLFLHISVIGFSWGIFNSQILSLGHVDILIGADLFYDNFKGLFIFLFLHAKIFFLTRTRLRRYFIVRGLFHEKEFTTQILYSLS
eukprot:TRINITY_DN2709_c0_g1_i14.p1 TRINITY_DN2709_c0_g1~~TRINITY_DN2709_c0_g1_i14.p1  ORF type:complete len:150 (-),score=10.72 TRINITY_DN2709_c0_g1_i14:446-895(-)